MLNNRYLLFFLLIPNLNIATPQLNLYYTDSVHNNNNIIQHDCLRVSVSMSDKEATNDRQVVYYCMDDVLPTNSIENNEFSMTKLTFKDLTKQNIKSEQLYLWSIPIDIIEHYEIYLTNDVSLENETIYNCTWPRFGPRCQYDLPYYYYYLNLSLSEIIRLFENVYDYKPTTFTCYDHFKCDRGAISICLDWSEICDGKIDCLNNGLDENDCWKLEINICKDDEYRCSNGQCIPKEFYHDRSLYEDCIDRTDERAINQDRTDLEIDRYPCHYEQPAFGLDDIICKFGAFTSSCVASRETAIIESIYLNKNFYQSENCWLACQHLWGYIDTNADKFCEESVCEEIIDDECPDVIYFPVITGSYNLYLAYEKETLFSLNFDYLTHYSDILLCSNETFYHSAFTYVDLISFSNDMQCSYLTDFCFYHLSFLSNYYADFCLKLWIFESHRYYTNANYSNEICNQTNMYRCENSEKCISFHRFYDGVSDCPNEDDEFNDLSNSSDIMKYLEKYYFECQNPSNLFIHPTLYGDGLCDCEETETDLCDDEIILVKYMKRNITFQQMCDGFTDIKPIITDERIDTDETECENWSCVNFNTYCDGVWNCPRGIDELGCPSPINFTCSENSHLCFSRETHEFICLPIEKANDKIIDCVGGTDERMRCLRNHFGEGIRYDFYSLQFTGQSCSTIYYLCNNKTECINGDDEKFCSSNEKSMSDLSNCHYQYNGKYSDYWKFMCNYLEVKYTQVKQFIFDGITQMTTIEKLTSQIKSYVQHQPNCYRGLFLRIFSSNNSTTNTCLCPPTFYGNQCQYQNQRISLAMKIRVSSDSWQTPFTILIQLIDDSQQRLIHSYEQLTYLAMYDCSIKFNIYLYYAKRPKDLTRNYSIHIDFYEKISLNYRGSSYIPIEFSFLPVHRLAFLVDIPRKEQTIRSCSTKQCIHGKCMYYSNQKTFCQCYPNWMGQDCSIPYQCRCSSHSKCIGISSDNRSICACPINKFGPRCYINTICQINQTLLCQNNGQCVPSDDYPVSNRAFRCICQDGFTGERCEIRNLKLIISFEQHIEVAQIIYTHFIELFNSTIEPSRQTNYRTSILRPNPLIIYWSQRFHLIFIQPTLSTYYLVVLQRIYKQSQEISKLITSSDRCLSINEIFNQTFAQLHPVRRMKYYHLPCQTNLSCFYDETHLCICANLRQNRLSNCFKFQHNMTFDCLGNNECLNNGQCFQDKQICPSKLVCVCPSCYYGRICQFNTNEIGLSLDTILGYHILPQVSLVKQTFIIQISLAFSIIFLIVGLIDGTFSLITFFNKKIYEVGCGMYLIGSSISTLFTMILFQLKFSILIFAHMKLILNDSFLLIQCQILDYFLRFSLNMDHWLSAIIATERTYTVLRGTQFDKKKSRQIARLAIICLSIFNCITILHDPIYRQLIYEGNDNDEIRRAWCVTNYNHNSALQTYNYFINIIHIFGPFLINVSSVFIFIRKKSEQQLTISNRVQFQTVLFEQFQKYKHILIAPIVLILLALPRFIIIFVTKCIESPNDVWLPLLGYFISFIPTMLTFLVFVLPSEFYLKQFNNIEQIYDNIYVFQIKIKLIN